MDRRTFLVSAFGIAGLVVARRSSDPIAVSASGPFFIILDNDSSGPETLQVTAIYD